MFNFSKKKWKRGDKLKIADLNRIEEGIVAAGESGGNESSDTIANVFWVTGTFTGGTVENISATFNEIYNAVLANKCVYLKIETPEEIGILSLVDINIQVKHLVFSQLGYINDIEPMPVIAIVDMGPVDDTNLDSELEAYFVSKILEVKEEG